MRGQLTGQIFIFIIAAIIFGLILLYGYRAVLTFTQTQEDVSLIELRDQLVSRIKQVSLSYGSVKRYEMPVSTKYSEVCFVESMDDKGALKEVAAQIYEKSPLIADALESGTNQNVFLLPFAETEIITAPLDIEGETAFLCIPNSGHIVLRLEGLGDRTRVSEWE